MPQVTIYHYAAKTRTTTLSAPSGKVHMALRFKGIEYRSVPVTPISVKKLNPRGRVPILEVDGARVVDSTDILTFLDERFPEPTLTPTDPARRAEAWLMEDWADEVLYFQVAWLRWGIPRNFVRMRAFLVPGLAAPMRWLVARLALRQAVGRFRAQGIGLKDEAVVRRELQQGLEAVMSKVRSAGGFLVGEDLTRADIALASNLDQLVSPGITPEAADAALAIDGVADYLDRVHARTVNAVVPSPSA